MNKERVLIFGASTGGENYLRRYGENFEVLAFIDNDTSKHGKKFHNKDIISVDEIKHYAYEKIIIPSTYGLEMKGQLLKKGIDENKITLPPKNSYKHTNISIFEDKITRDIGHQIISIIASQAYKKKLPLFIEWGTLIGIVRDGGIIPWDDDIDFSSLLDLFDEVIEFLFDIKQFLESQTNSIIAIKNLKNKITIDIQSKDKSFYDIHVDIDFKEIKNNEAIQISNPIWYTPAKHIEKLDTFMWNGVKIYIPSNVDKYLSFVYGDWKTPKRDYSMDDYNNYKKV